MLKKKYGVLKGTILGHIRDANDDHYQILVKAGRDMFRVAVNVKSATPKSAFRPQIPDDYAIAE